MTGHSWAHDLIAIGLVLLAVYAFAQAFKLRRRDAKGHLNKMAKRATVTTKEQWAKRMETTKADLNQPRSLRRW
jgi:hypothetical protein